MPASAQHRTCCDYGHACRSQIDNDTRIPVLPIGPEDRESNAKALLPFKRLFPAALKIDIITVYQASLPMYG